MPVTYRFDRFELDCGNRRLSRDGVTLDLNARYFDALALLVRTPGQLITKDRFLADVWSGVPVTDEALTQCIKTLRKQLGDDAGQPRFIETVPKHGYRFIAPVSDGAAPASPRSESDWARLLRIGAAGTIGGGVAGLCGGLFYGAAGASESAAMGGASSLLVLICLTMLVGLIGGAGVSFGIAAAANRPPLWSLLGGALGGLIVGALVKLIGVDALALLFGAAPTNITGGGEGAVLGAAVGLAAWLATRGISLRRGVAFAALAGVLVGAMIHTAGGRLMAGSLAALAEHFPNSRLDLDRLGALFGEASFGPLTHAITTSLEAALFCAFVVAALTLARRS